MAPDRHARTPQRGFRRDIEGIRALAVLLVMLGHAGVPFLPGGFVGVDVFFVISGFLITGLLLAELERTDRISLVGFYARRAKRLLPAVVVVLLTTLLLTLLLLPPLRWRDTAGDVIASGLYVMNWRLAAQAVDYLHADDAPSAVQHFWSLAVEEQFYLIWPLLLIAAGALAARLAGRGAGRRPLRPLALVGLALIGVPSLLWSVYLSAAEPARAYFVTTTRLWELVVGAVLAVTATGLGRLPRPVAAALGWVGLAAVVTAGLVITPLTAFPGWAALLPTLGTAAIIAGGFTAGRTGPEALLGLRPLRAVGALSYSLYLWHWPLLVVARARLGELGAVEGMAVVALSVVPAALTYRFVENPVRRSPRLAGEPARALRLGLVCTVLPVVAALGFQFGLAPAPLRPDQTAAAPGAAALPSGPAAAVPGVEQVDHVVPEPASARADVAEVYGAKCIVSGTDAPARTCVYGDRDSEFAVALVGDSHAAQWFPALRRVVEERGWRLVTYLKSSCPFLAAPVIVKNQPFPSCEVWNDNVRAALTGPDRPDLVLATASSEYRLAPGGRPLYGAENDQARVDALRQAWSSATGPGTLVVGLRDTPRPNFDIPECVSLHRDRLTECGFSRETAAALSISQERAAAGLPGVVALNLNDAICPAASCPPIIGGVLVYRDNNHLTATYAGTLGPRLGSSLDELVRARPELSRVAYPG
ncbi:acyltransferase family protein [Micromonospora sp. WMMD975]|uniref:acyltransferase family protein n=1 Tax=Micromonospora sp. WMMD975 TaxID=3016087 RepID=UPI00249BB8EE|nr:acyltransferase family protein [Micromonospora sp. WMMD975]WFE35068.1 acyltransferase family protein [Micromonospora sp. WMMD975]